MVKKVKNSMNCGIICGLKVNKSYSFNKTVSAAAECPEGVLGGGGKVTAGDAENFWMNANASCSSMPSSFERAIALSCSSARRSSASTLGTSQRETEAYCVMLKS
jgi:hypothetical protein